MVPYWQRAILIALILSIAVPSSTAHRRRWRRSPDSNPDDSENYLRDLCSESKNSDACWNILKSPLRRFENSDDKDIANGVIDLARAKSKEIREKLDQWHRDSNDENLKRKYYSCSQNYNDVDRSLERALKNLGSSFVHQKIRDEIEDSQGELDKCRRQFGSGSFDPAHVGDRNRELGVYLDVVRAAAERLEGYYRDDYIYRNLH